MIYVLIAGTYTPVVLIVLPAGWLEPLRRHLGTDCYWHREKSAEARHPRLVLGGFLPRHGLAHPHRRQAPVSRPLARILALARRRWRLLHHRDRVFCARSSLSA